MSFDAYTIWIFYAMNNITFLAPRSCLVIRHILSRHHIFDSPIATLSSDSQPAYYYTMSQNSNLPINEIGFAAFAAVTDDDTATTPLATPAHSTASLSATPVSVSYFPK